MAASGIAKRRAAARAEGSKHYVERRRALIKAAATVFKERGLADTSIDDIAKAAGVDRASLYYYVASKRELFEEVVQDALVSNIEMAERIREKDAPADEKLTELLNGLLTSYAEYYPHLYVFVQEDASRIAGRSDGGADIADLQRRFDRALISIIQEGMEAGVFRSDIPPRLAAYGIIGMANWTHRWFNPDGPVGPEEVGRAFSALAIDGLRGSTR